MSARIGIVGLGRMGMGICANLARAGHEVTAGDARAERERAAAESGARWAASSREVAEAADVMITVLPSHVQVGAVAGEVLAALRPGATWIDMSTCAPREGRELAQRAEAAGARWLEAPLGGGVDAAEAGTLTLFVGGEADLLAQQRELLTAVSKEIRHMGGHGAGYATKLLVNLLWFGQAVASAEALLLARREGIDLGVLREAIDSSPAASHFIRSDVDAPLRGDYLASFSIDRCVEELAAVTALARDHGVPHELASVVESVHRQALERYGPVDGELLAVALLEELAGTRLGDWR